ncbi:hypothetical protein BDZ89DRAFT_1052969 [Hymenopellis radicata]|nr:hypothetical protein BDZ89DRAFT_1052969 [Hymenopellis radicata]
MPPRVKKRVVTKKATTKVAATKRKNQTSDADNSDGRKHAGSASVIATGAAKKRQRCKSAPKEPEVPEPVPEDEAPAEDLPMDELEEAQALLKKKQAQWSAPCYNFFSLTWSE